MMRLLDCHARLAAVKRSSETARTTVEAFLMIAEANPDHLNDLEITIQEVQKLAVELEGMYFLRLFAAFESCVRDYWRNGVRNTKPLTETLIASLATRRGVPQDILDEVQQIRDYRNAITHDDHEPVRAYSLMEASRYLNTFLARLLRNW